MQLHGGKNSFAQIYTNPEVTAFSISLYSASFLTYFKEQEPEAKKDFTQCFQ